MKILILLLSLLTCYFPQAYAQKLSAREVSKIYYNSGCHSSYSGVCRNGIMTQTYSQSLIRALPSGLQDILLKRAHDQAQVWGDTILEGDYTADGKTRLDKVTLIRMNQRLLGYLIHYSEKAWYTGTCRYSHYNPQSLQSCKTGRIQEASFLSADLGQAEVDENQFADFVSRD